METSKYFRDKTGEQIGKVFVGGFQKIYDMRLGDRVKYDLFDIWRVPSGWIFGCDGGESGITHIFVPYEVPNF